jgi:hypothetical protein
VKSGNSDEGSEERREHEKHRDEQQAASQEHGGEELVLGFPNAGADRAHEPQEEDAAERHQAKRELDLAAAACLGQPRTGVMRVGGHDPAEQDDNEPEQDGKDNPGQAGSTRRPEHSWRNLICRPTRHVTHPES